MAEVHGPHPDSTPTHREMLKLKNSFWRAKGLNVNQPWFAGSTRHQKAAVDVLLNVRIPINIFTLAYRPSPSHAEMIVDAKLNYFHLFHILSQLHSCDLNVKICRKLKVALISHFE